MKWYNKLKIWFRRNILRKPDPVLSWNMFEALVEEMVLRGRLNSKESTRLLTTSYTMKKGAYIVGYGPLNFHVEPDYDLLSRVQEFFLSGEWKTPHRSVERLPQPGEPGCHISSVTEIPPKKQYKAVELELAGGGRTDPARYKRATQYALEDLATDPANSRWDESESLNPRSEIELENLVDALTVDKND